jgi:chromosome segregation ATPase
MSTAGKVLSVLVALMMLVSIYLLAMVSQLNRSWGRGIETVSTQVEETEQQVRQANADAYAIQKQVVSERQITDAQLRSLKLRVEDLENRVSLLKEDQVRLELRLAGEEDLLARTNETIAGREQEQAELQAGVAELNSLRDRLAAENTERLGRLSSLQDQLTALLAENQELLQQVASRSTDADADATENTE